jgi:aspartate racemase
MPESKEAKMKIGILGGIGPEATAEFYSRLVKGLQKTGKIRDNRDYPQIIINSIPAPELVGESITEADLALYIEGLIELDSFSPDFILMVCNTIHLFFEMLQKKIKTPLIDIRQEVKRELESRGIKKASVVGSPKTVSKGLYKFEGITYINPDNEELKQLSKAIFEYNKGSKKSISTVKDICIRCLKNNSEIILLACTEIAEMMKKEAIPKIDTIEFMVNAVIKRFIHLSAKTRIQVGSSP